MIRPLLAFAIATLACLPAQIIDTIGGQTSAPSGALRGKGSLFAVNTSVVLTEYEMYFNVPAQETLTWFIYRHHSRSGTASLLWTSQTTVPGGIGPAFYSTGPIAVPLVAGNHYMIGCYWQGSITYYYSTATTGSPVSFGTWQRAHTLNAPPAPTFSIPAGVDVAQYYQRLTTVPVNSVVNTGTGCSATTLLPRLVAGNFFSLGTTTQLELVDAAPSTIALFGLAGGPALPAPFPLFGCSIWLDVSGPVATVATLASATGYANLPVAVPGNPALLGTSYTSQGLVFGAAIDVANAVTFTIQ